VVVSDWWLSDWADCSSLNLTLLEETNRTARDLCSLNVDQRVGVYGGTVLSVIIVNLTRTIAFFFVCVNASRILHNQMFASILRAPVLFFDTNPIGRILNRFSKDVGFLDDLLPFQFCEYMLLLLRFLAIIITACVSNPWVLIPALIIMACFVLLRTYYLKTSRDIKRLEAVARSPLYSHISTTLQGLPTIRSFHQEDAALKYLYRFQNEHSQGWYLYLVSTRWFGMRIDFVSGVFLATVAFSSIPLAGSLNAGLVGLGLTYTVSLAGMFQYCVRLSAEVENVMISAERIMAYSKLESEASLETTPPHQPPPSDWPSRGALVFSDVAFRYSPDLPLVLKNLSFSVKPSEKIGIVGRTGAGKSSLISVLFRLAEPFGQVTVDGVDSKEIGLHDLRSRISIIPQDPVLFSGTVRYNLDPFSDCTDMQLWGVLEQVQLKSAVEELKGGLEATVTEGGTNFSVGQKQLVCLARALLRNNKILVLDEATANVDIKTDGIIQKALREQFVDCTVLTIAHRLNTIMDSDRILVMNRGQVKEFDRPSRLLQRPDSLFHRMVEQTGDVAARKLFEMAEEAERRRTAARRGSIL
jgi:ATP-binding cassette subfamily C (CFTR/MRP) protein 4